MNNGKIIEHQLIGMSRLDGLDFASYSIDNRALWDNLPDSLKAQVKDEVKDYSFSGDDYITLSLFRDFKATGNRKRLENIYFAKRRKLSNLVIAECIENSEKYLPLIEEGIWALLSEPAWVVPAHNSYIRDTEQADTPLLWRPVLDLFACETGEILALTRCVLKDRLSPILSKNIEWALLQRTVHPYISDSFWWMGGQGSVNNWTPWCTQNVLIAALSLDRLDEKTRFKVIRQAVTALDLFIDGYPDDGACSEGASYYHAAALAMFGALRLVEAATAKDFSPVYRNEKIKAMAGYIEDVHIAGDMYLNYADCSPKAGWLGAREFLFAKATGNSAMMHHAALDYMKYGFEEDDNSYNLYYKLMGVSSYREIAEEAVKNVTVHKPAFKCFADSQLAIWREKDITFAIKGGNNGESHNHNDVGSIILYKGDRALLCDIGVETYTKITFSPDRYTLKPMQSAYHNLVNFSSLVQKDGENYKAKNVRFDENSSYMDLRGAYPEDERLRSYSRSAFFDRNKMEIMITDDFDTDLTPVLSLISQEKPEIKGRRLCFSSFAITFPQESECETETMEITDARLRTAWPDRLYRNLVTLKGPASWVISFNQEKGENI